MAAAKQASTIADKMKAKRIAERLRSHHRLGQRANDKKLTPEEIELHNEYTLDKFQAFADNYTQKELNELCESARPNDLPLHWGYIPYLLTIQAKAAVKYGVDTDHRLAKEARREFQNEAVKNGWSVAELRAAISVAFPMSPAAGRGRRLSPPKDLALGIISFLRDLGTVVRRAELLSELARKRRRTVVSQELTDLASTLSMAQKQLRAKSARMK